MIMILLLIGASISVGELLVCYALCRMAARADDVMEQSMVLLQRAGSTPTALLGDYGILPCTVCCLTGCAR
jgi:hypothetical protein